jgi:VIT1/CCC1 family predicted Fe2+/Mn2+ transporter
LHRIDGMEHEHTPDAIRKRLARGPRRSYLRDAIYGGIDGAVTTFAAVAGVVGAQLSPGVVLVIGFANLVADGFSMAASNYLGTRAELDDFRRLEAIEKRHIEITPEGEEEEVRQIFEKKGFEGEDLRRIVELTVADRTRWVATMLAEEYGLPAEVRPPTRAAAATFGAFVTCGLVPLLPFLGATAHAFELSAALTAAVFFAIGAAKSIWSTKTWWRSGLATLAIGAVAAGLAYVVGILLRNLVRAG